MRLCFPLFGLLVLILSFVRTFIGFRGLDDNTSLASDTPFLSENGYPSDSSRNVQHYNQDYRFSQQEQWSSSTDVQQSNNNNNNKLVPAFTFLQLDQPLKLNLFLKEHNATASVIIASAIRQHEKVAFIVVEEGIPIAGYEHPRQALPSLPRGLGCAFTKKKVDDNGIRQQLKPTSMIEVYAHTLRSYNSSSIWICDMPATPAKEWNYVSIILPEWAERVSGNGVFRLGQELSKQNLTGRINACNKHIYDITNMTSQHLNEYTNHYRRLGVEHFTFYFEQGKEEHVFDLTDGIDKHTHVDIQIIWIPASLRKLWNDPFNDVLLLEKFTSNDCLWRSKAMELNWTLVMFDLDEFLVGTRDLPSFLSTWSYPLLYIKHQLVKFPHTMPRIYPNKHLNIAATPDGDMGKTIYRTSKINVAWTHYPTSPNIHRKRAQKLKLLHFRNATEIRFFREREHHEWMEYVV